MNGGRFCDWHKAEISDCDRKCPLSGKKRTWQLHCEMSANDPKAGIYAKIFSEAMTIDYGALHATIASGRIRLATDGGAKIAR